MPVTDKPKNRIAVRVLPGLGTFLTILAIFSIWADRQALNTDEWVNTTDKLLDHPDVQTALAGYLTDELYTNVDAQAEIAAELPPRAAPLAGRIAGALKQATNTAATRILASPKVDAALSAA